jgi:hypothetical protein
MTSLMFAFYTWFAAITGVCPNTLAAPTEGPGLSAQCSGTSAPPPAPGPERPDWASNDSRIYNGF